MYFLFLKVYMYSSSEHLQQKKRNLSSTTSELYSNSVQRLAKTLSYNGTETIAINPDVFNDNSRYIYFINKPSNNTVYSNANKFPLLIYNGSGSCAFDSLLNNSSVNKIHTLLLYMKNDDFSSAFENLGTAETQEILYGLYSLKQSISGCFSGLIDLYENAFLTIKFFSFLYGDMKGIEATCNKYKTDSEILNDRVQLKAWIEQLQLNMNVITSVSIQAAKLNIKPEYQKYIDLYGLPYKSVFDKVLLQDIIDEMYGNNT